MLTSKIMWVFAIVALCVAGVLAVRRQWGFARTLGMLLLVSYVAVLLAITMFPIPIDARLIHDRTAAGEGLVNNAIPFATMRAAYALGPDVFAFQVAGNLALLFPLGLLLPLAFVKLRRPGRAMLAIFGAAAAVEIAQLLMSAAIGFTYRQADVDDLILNVAGGLLGYGVFKVAERTRALFAERSRTRALVRESGR